MDVQRLRENSNGADDGDDGGRKHTHDDGTEHSHEGGDEPHDHDEPNENPDIGSYDSLPSDVEPIKDDLDKIEDSLDDPK